jgi:hypothetical protein
MATVNDRIDELLEQWETLRESGRTIPAAELCLDCPESVRVHRVADRLQTCPTQRPKLLPAGAV